MESIVEFKMVLTDTDCNVKITFTDAAGFRVFESSPPLQYVGADEKAAKEAAQTVKGLSQAQAGATDALKQFKFGGAIFAGIIVVFLIIVTLAKKRLEKSATAMIEESEEAKARAKKLREAEMKRPNA